MEVPDGLLGLLLLALIAAVSLWRYEVRRRTKLASTKTSQSTRYGQLTERFAPWLAHWPFEPGRFRFIGQPIDGVQFEEDAVYLVEIKSSDAQLAPHQRRIRELVRQGRVGWMQFSVREERVVETLRPWEKQ